MPFGEKSTLPARSSLLSILRLCREPSQSAPAVFCLTLVFLLRGYYIHHARIDSDEPQHLHVVWGWTKGLLQYRDLFDNHTPLFHLLMAPVLLVMGENANIIVWMRWAMVPAFIFCLWCIYRLGCRLFDAEVALWGAILSGLSPRFFLVIGEFRSDVLWVALWLAALVVLVDARLSFVRTTTVGLLFGLMLTTSLKTTLLLLALAVAFLVVVVTSIRCCPRGYSVRKILTAGLGMTAGLSAAPLLLLAFYYWEGAIPSLLQGTIYHNYVPKLGQWKHWHMAWLFLPELAVLFLVGRAVWHTAPSLELAQRRLLVFLGATLYLSLLVSFWPLLAPESFLPFYPIGSLFLTAFLFAARASFSRWQQVAIVLVVAATEVTVIGINAPPWEQGVAAERALLADVLRLTSPDDYVMDGKGETVFRRRAFFPIFEHITRNRIALHLTQDSMRADLIEKRVCVVTSFHPFTKADSDFIDHHYLSVGPLSVAGQVLPDALAGISVDFEIVIPTTYKVVSTGGAVTGKLDGETYTGARFLEIGQHRLQVDSEVTRLAIIWDRAVDRGYTPFRATQGAPPVLY